MFHHCFCISSFFHDLLSLLLYPYVFTIAGKGKFVNHKGKHRSFTNPDELEEQRKREEKERQWRVCFSAIFIPYLLLQGSGNNLISNVNFIFCLRLKEEKFHQVKRKKKKRRRRVQMKVRLKRKLHQKKKMR